MNRFHPEYISTIVDLLGSEAPQFWEIYHHKPAQGLRIHPAKSDLEEIQKILPGTYTSLPWSEHGFHLQTQTQPGKHPYHGAGLYYLQEPSAMAPVSILDPQPGERVLDLCAAPGGKTTQISARMKGKGLIIANDPNPNRVQALAKNLERWGVRNAAVLRETPSRLASHFGGYFDRVLVDAPCSGEGTFRMDPGEIKKWSPSFSQRLAGVQDEILWQAGKLVRPGGLLVYSTCTFNLHENEGTVARFLAANPDFNLEKIPLQKGYSPGYSPPGHPEGDFSRTVRIWPHLTVGEGHFAARMRKKSLHAPPSPGSYPDYAARSSLDHNGYKTFYETTLRNTPLIALIHPKSPGLTIFGNQLYWLAEEAPSLEGLSVVHWGWWLGTVRSDRFSPGPALATAVTTGDAQKVLEFSLGEPELQAYLRGSPIKLSHQTLPGEGWCLIAVNDHPLGWGKIQQGKLKSYYPRWLRLN